jgi:hypothetical protein
MFDLLRFVSGLAADLVRRHGELAAARFRVGRRFRCRVWRRRSGDECPVVPGAKRDDWPLTDPKGKPVDEVRRIRDELRDASRKCSTPRDGSGPGDGSHSFGRGGSDA